MDHLVENKVAFTLEIEYEDIKDVIECKKDDLLRQYGDWVEYGKRTWRIELFLALCPLPEPCVLPQRRHF